MRAEPVTHSLDFPSSVLFQRLRALGRLLGLGIGKFENGKMALSLELAAATRAPGWSAGEVSRPGSVSLQGVPTPQGLCCPDIFGEPKDLHRYGHIALASPVVPWPARPILAALLDDTEENIRELLCTDPARLVARVEVAEAEGRRTRGLSPAQLVWWSIPVIPPVLRAMRLEEALRFFSDTSFTRTVNAGYIRIINRSARIRTLLEIEAPEEMIHHERSTLASSVDMLLANAELDEPCERDDDYEKPRAKLRMMDATTLFFEALTPRLVEIGEKNAAAPGGDEAWLARAARIGREQGRGEPRLAALWRLAAECPREPHTDDLMKEFLYEGQPFPWEPSR